MRTTPPAAPQHQVCPPAIIDSNIRPRRPTMRSPPRPRAPRRQQSIHDKPGPRAYHDPRHNEEPSASRAPEASLAPTRTAHPRASPGCQRRSRFSPITAIISPPLVAMISPHWSGHDFSPLGGHRFPPLSASRDLVDDPGATADADNATTWASQAPRETLAVGLVKAEAVLGKRCSSHEMAAMSAAVRSTRPMADPRGVGSTFMVGGNSRTSISRDRGEAINRRNMLTTCQRRTIDRVKTIGQLGYEGWELEIQCPAQRSEAPKVERRSPLVQRRDLLKRGIRSTRRSACQQVPR